jgi:hypothetical protein
MTRAILNAANICASAEKISAGKSRAPVRAMTDSPSSRYSAIDEKS